MTSIEIYRGYMICWLWKEKHLELCQGAQRQKSRAQVVLVRQTWSRAVTRMSFRCFWAAGAPNFLGASRFTPKWVRHGTSMSLLQCSRGQTSRSGPSLGENFIYCAHGWPLSQLYTSLSLSLSPAAEADSTIVAISFNSCNISLLASMA